MRVEREAADGLLSGVRDLAAATVEAGIGRSERMARASLAAERTQALLALVPLLDPYSDRQHSRLGDMLRRGGVGQLGHKWEPSGSDADVHERLELVALRDQLADQLRHTRAAANLTGLHTGVTVTGLPVPVASPARFLDGYALPASAPLGPKFRIPDAWPELPEAVIDQRLVDVLAGDGVTLTGTDTGWTTAAWGADESRQLIDWSPAAAAEARAAHRRRGRHRPRAGAARHPDRRRTHRRHPGGRRDRDRYRLDGRRGPDPVRRR